MSRHGHVRPGGQQQQSAVAPAPGLAHVEGNLGAPAAASGKDEIAASSTSAPTADEIAELAKSAKDGSASVFDLAEFIDNFGLEVTPDEAMSFHFRTMPEKDYFALFMQLYGKHRLDHISHDHLLGYSLNARYGPPTERQDRGEGS